MHWIRTQGSWREMGRQYGEQLCEQLHEMIGLICPWLRDDPDKYRSTVETIRANARAHCPMLLEETAGMAEAAQLDETVLLGYRFLNELRTRAPQDCSVLFLAETDRGPLLGRNCDIQDWAAPLQVCQTMHPDDGPGGIYISYVGMGVGVGMNEHGLGVCGASAHSSERYGEEGISTPLLLHKLFQRCRTLDDAQQLMSEHKFFGKSAVWIIADAKGRSALFELAQGATPICVPRSEGRNWQVCTNFYQSGRIPIKRNVTYLQNGYARYGRLVAELDGGHAGDSFDSAKRLLTDVSQSHLCCDGEAINMVTAYSQVCELANGKMHVTAGSPADQPYQEVAL